MDISTNANALDAISAAIRKNHADQIMLIDNYVQTIMALTGDWDDSAYNALLDAVKLQSLRVKQLIEQTSDFPPYLNKLAEAIRENEQLSRRGI